jgi:E3 ubiquitin-protein ligase TRIP12
MPSLFILSIINLVIQKYKDLFNLNQEYFKNAQEFIDLFINSKVTLLISKACGDAYSVSKSNLPSWCKNLSSNCGFLSKFDSRQLLFITSFGPRRSLINLQNYLKSKDPNYHGENITLEKSMRLKIIVERNKIIEGGLKLIDNPVTSRFKGYLEFEFMGEIGNGIGPTLEFYRLFTEIIYANKELWYKTTDKSIYPAIGLNNNNKCLQLFKLIGYIVARAIFDDRLIDFPISRVFWNLLLDKAVTFNDIKKIDKDLYNVLNDLMGLIKQKKEYLEQNKDNKVNDDELEEKILYNGKKLSSLDIYFTFPGYDIELKKNGSNILLTMKNVEEYVNLIYDYLFYKGIYQIKEAFIEGFNIVFDIYDLKCFTSEELEEIILGSDEQNWEEEVLIESTKPEHGYNKNSRIFKDLIKYMMSLNKDEQKKFLTFTTGASRLPVGGFKALSPKLTVVKKTCNGNENPDDFLPTVMTCQNYLKIPEYSSYEIFKEKFTLAMNEGNNEFHLS